MEQSNIKFIPSVTSHKGLKALCISADKLSLSGNGNFQCIEATKKDRFIKLRIILSENLAANVTIPTANTQHDICYYRYLRFLTRNRACVLVHFDELLIKASKIAKEIVLCADDYIILDSEGKAIPCILDREYIRAEEAYWDVPELPLI